MPDYAEEIRELFSNPGKYRDWYRRNEILYQNEKTLVNSFNPKDCLDMGSGPGIFHEVLRGETVSLDLSEHMLSAFEGDRVVGDVRQMPFRDKAFECSFSAVTVCFVDDLDSFFREASRVTRKLTIICFIPLDSSWGEHYAELGKKGHHYYSKAIFRPKDEIMKVFTKYFKLESIRSTLAFRPDERPKVQEPMEGETGSFICVSGPPLIGPSAGPA
ncbi:SAM-dependent methyltransferase [Sulfolobales archaeon SCGC AB-777_J03]|jgi:Methylase involved in ubiquinone/menaquinone biosynthesis|nr:SAM-dependent methyltransferase [Sulfolobales archaeon SCGC AB-777_J03]